MVSIPWKLLEILMYSGLGGGAIYGGGRLKSWNESRKYRNGNGGRERRNGTFKDIAGHLGQLVTLTEYQVKASRTHHYMEIAQGRLQRAIARHMRDPEGRQAINLEDFVDPDKFVLPPEP